MKKSVLLYVFTMLLSQTPCYAADNVVLDWNAQAMSAVRKSRSWGPELSRIMAMMHVAMFDAANAVDSVHHPYIFRKVDRKASSRVAIASAAHTVLSSVFPVRSGQWDKELKRVLAIRDDGNPLAGISLGKQAAEAILQSRRKDGSGAGSTYIPVTKPGIYLPTIMPISPHWGKVKPWLLASADQYRPSVPPELKSKQWAQALNEVQEKGSHNNVNRPRELSQIAQFWTLAGPQTYNPFIRQLAATKAGSLTEQARDFALFHMAVADTYIATWDAKYHFNFWRPVTAIRNAANDGNTSTLADDSWLPVIQTPMHPEYPCAHCAVVSSAVTVLEVLYGKPKSALSLGNPEYPRIQRRYKTYKALADEVAAARLWGGVHYSFSIKAGQELGRNVARHAIGQFLSGKSASNQ